MREGRDPGLRNVWTVLTDGERPRRAAFFVRSYDKARLCALLRRAGLAPSKFWGGLDGSPRRPDSRRLVVLARKPR